MLLSDCRDGYLVTVPEVLNVRLEVLQEARFYSLNNLVAILTGNKSALDVITQSSSDLLNAKTRYGFNSLSGHTHSGNSHVGASHRNGAKCGVLPHNSRLLRHFTRCGDEIARLVQRTSIIPPLSQAQYDSNRKALSTLYERSASMFRGYHNNSNGYALGAQNGSSPPRPLTDPSHDSSHDESSVNMSIVKFENS